jgi:hypothetical protein
LSRNKRNKRRPEPLELFLDDGFSNPEVAASLRAAGFVVHEFTRSFPRKGDLTKREQGVEDPPVIKLCHEKSWLMVTTDKEMCKKHRACIRRHRNVTILATAHNGLCLPDEWVKGIIVLREELTEMFATQRRPWFVFFSREGKITATRDRMF